MSRFRVLLVSHAYVTPFNRAKAEALTASGEAEVTLLVPNRWEVPVPPLVGTARYRLVRLPAVFPRRGGRYFYRTGLSSLVMGFRPDLVHVEEEPWSVSAFQFARLKHKAGFRYALFSWENLRKDFRGVRGWMEQRTLRSVDLGIGGNEAAASELRRKGVKTVHVLPQLGLDPEWFRPSERSPAGVFTMGYVGRITPEKGIHLLLQAAARLGGGWRLRILGSGPEQGHLRTLAEESAVLDRVEFLPAIPHAGVATFLRTLDVLVLPSLTTRHWAEQFGHVLIEAMSAETPVVASNSGAIPEVVGEAGLLFPEGDISALKEALARLRDDPELALVLGARGRKRVLEHFTWDQIAGKTLALYRSLLNCENSATGTSGSAPVELGRSGRD